MFDSQVFTWAYMMQLCFVPRISRVRGKVNRGHYFVSFGINLERHALTRDTVRSRKRRRALGSFSATICPNECGRVKGNGVKTSIAGERALVTGAGSGIGRALAVRLASLGCSVTLVGRTQARLDETAMLCDEASKQAGYGEQTVSHVCDLTSEPAIVELVHTVDAEGGLDILVNNAGIVQAGQLESITTEEFDAVMATNVRAPFILMRETLPLLRKSNAAEVVNICSVVAHDGYPNQSAYVASKHALYGMSKSFAREVFDEGIRVHVISPGGVLTDMVAIARPDLTGTPMIVTEDMADALEYLLCHRTDAVCDEIRLHRVTKTPY